MPHRLRCQHRITLPGGSAGNLAARKTNTYGAIGIALAVLLWVYILGRIMVASAGLNAALYYRRENRTGQG